MALSPIDTNPFNDGTLKVLIPLDEDLLSLISPVDCSFRDATATYEDGSLGNSARLVGANPNIITWDNNTNSATVYFRVKLSSALSGTNVKVYESYTYSELIVSGTEITVASTHGNQISTGTPMVYDQWVEFALVHKTTASTDLYMNNVLIGTSSGATQTHYTSMSLMQNVDGLLDQVMFFIRELTQSEITALHDMVETDDPAIFKWNDDEVLATNWNHDGLASTHKYSFGQTERESVTLKYRDNRMTNRDSDINTDYWEFLDDGSIVKVGTPSNWKFTIDTTAKSIKMQNGGVFWTADGTSGGVWTGTTSDGNIGDYPLIEGDGTNVLRNGYINHELEYLSPLAYELGVSNVDRMFWNGNLISGTPIPLVARYNFAGDNVFRTQSVVINQGTFVTQGNRFNLYDYNTPVEDRVLDTNYIEILDTGWFNIVGTVPQLIVTAEGKLTRPTSGSLNPHYFNPSDLKFYGNTDSVPGDSVQNARYSNLTQHDVLEGRGVASSGSSSATIFYAPPIVDRDA